MPVVLAIDDDRSVRHLVEETFKNTDIQVRTAGSADEGLALLTEIEPEAVLLDVMLPANTSGLDVFEQIRKIDPKLPVIFISACSDSDTPIEAIKGGAYDFLFKPIDVAQMRGRVEKALEMRRLMNVPVLMPNVRRDDVASDVLVGRSPQMLEVYKSIGRVAPEDVTVLVLGESGTGKELIARAIYQHSLRAKGPFLAVNCAAIHETLLESELFGHEKGSFTGADQRRIGKFEHCSGGTIFLDEVGDMSPMVQSKLLRVLQEKKFERVGGNTTIQTDTRVIAATNRDLEAMVASGDFREDLFYRLNGFTIELPALRERDGDLLLLIEHFFALNTPKKDEAKSISPEAMEYLLRHTWPGNVRELQSVVKQTLLQTRGPVVLPEYLPKSVRAPREGGTITETSGNSAINLGGFVEQRISAGSRNLYAEVIEQVERYLLTRVLTSTEGNQSTAAKMLGITRASVRHKLRSLGVQIEQVVSVSGDGDE